MILILTYHKVLPKAQAADEFYSVTDRQLEMHIDLLRKHDFTIAQPLELLESRPSSSQICVLTFDDGTIDHFEIVKPLLENLNCRGLFFVPTAKLNRPGRLSSEHVREFSAAGHVIGSHSHEHERLDRLAEEDIRVQLELAQENLQRITGMAPLIFAPPGGFTNKTLRTVAGEFGIKAIRTMRWGRNESPALLDLECVPINCSFTEVQLSRILEGRNLQFRYQAKQMAKSVIPARMYEPLRSFVSGMMGRN